MTKHNYKEEELPSMSLGDHLEELRLRMILALAGIVLGLIVCLFFGKHLIGFLERPYNQAMGLTQLQPMANTEQNVKNPADDTEQKSANQIEIEIQTDEVASGVSTNNLQPRLGLQTKKPAEGFTTYLKICLVFGLLLTSPWFFWQVWSFVSSGLYRHEQKFIRVVSPVSALLFVTGALFFLFMVAPLAMTFFMKFNEALNLASFWMFEDYINLILMLMLVFGLAFQMPIAIVFAERMGLVSIETLANGRKYVIVALTIIAAMATPPDVISQICLFIPMYALFESGIVACRLLSKEKVN
ncbi:MAG: twin-arginine translocase subunit TatC [Planctomycetota bacterium]